MTILLILIISLPTIIFSKYFFTKWFNHLFLYSVSWGIFLILYELKLIRYTDISNEAFFIFLVAYVAIISGVLTFYFARNVFICTKDGQDKIQIHSFLLDENFKILKFVIVAVSVIGFYSAYQNWSYLLHKFGSLTAIMLRAHTIYRMRISGELELGIPYLSILPYIGIVLSGIYTAARGKISLYTALPLLSIIVSDIAMIGRGGIFVGFVMLVTSFTLFRNIVPNIQNYQFNMNKKALVVGGLILIMIVISSLSLVAELRGRFEGFKGKSREFSKFDNVPLFSASEYFYFSSNVGVFSKYFESQVEKSFFAENSLLPIHSVLSKFGFIERPNFYPKGYRIPSWSNAATYLRDLHSDFGVIGMFLVPYFLSLATTFFWFRFYNNGDMLSFIYLNYLIVILSFSVFNMQTRSAFFLVSFLILVVSIKVFEKFSKTSNSKNQLSEDQIKSE